MIIYYIYKILKIYQPNKSNNLWIDWTELYELFKTRHASGLTHKSEALFLLEAGSRTVQ